MGPALPPLEGYTHRMVDRRITLFLALGALFVTSLVVGDLIGSKLIGVPFFGEARAISAGFIPFPITFLLTDLLNEFYGKQAARTVTWVGLAMSIFTLLVVSAAVATPFFPPQLEPGWGGVHPEQYEAVFASGRRILLSSMVAYVVAQLIDIAVFGWLKKKTNGRYLWLRATGSTVGSQLIDTIVITSLVWGNTLDPKALGALIFNSWVGKLLIAVALTPLIYGAHSVVEKVLHIAPLPPGEGQGEGTS